MSMINPSNSSIQSAVQTPASEKSLTLTPPVSDSDADGDEDDEAYRETVDELWFEDGGLVIKAQNKLYRVYSGMLSNRSVVFRGMLRKLQQQTPKQYIDGCPVLKLSDPPEDVTHFLRAIYDVGYFVFAENPSISSKPSFHVVAAVLRMSHKYDVATLRRRALYLMTAAFPTTLEQWDEQAEKSSLDYEETNLVEIICLAREVNALWILPAAFYALCMHYPLSDMYEETEFKADDFRACLHGFPVQVDTKHKIIQFLRPIEGDPNKTKCGNRKNCARGRALALDQQQLWDDMQWVDQRWCDPLNFWVEDDWQDLKKKVCNQCIERAKDEHNVARYTFWERLPETYKLPSWGELDRMKGSAMNLPD